MHFGSHPSVAEFLPTRKATTRSILPCSCPTDVPVYASALQGRSKGCNILKFARTLSKRGGMVSVPNILVAFLIGALVGCFATWLLVKNRISGVQREMEAQARAENAVLKERVESNNREVENLKQAVQHRDTELTESRSKLNDEIRMRVAAEERSKRIPELESDIQAKENQVLASVQKNTDLSSLISELQATLKAERAGFEEKLTFLQEIRANLAEKFESLATAALKSNNDLFLDLAKTELDKHGQKAIGELEQRKQAVDTLVRPITIALEQVEKQIRDIELERKGSYEGLTEQLRQLASGQQVLQTETGNLVKALRAPTVRGRWGEIQLQRVVEMAGMLEYCDFVQQETISTEDGRLRPDLVVKLPGRKNIVVEAKAPLEAYLNALEALDESAKRQHMQAHAKQIKDHIIKLSAKAYWDQFSPAPEFVVMFLPGEMFFSAALQEDPALIEYGVNSQVIVASPTTLIALLKAVAYGWRQETIGQSVQQISDLGKELYDRLSTFRSHLESMSSGLDKAVDAYNKAVGSFESRVLVSARKFVDLGAVAGQPIEALSTVEKGPKSLGAGSGN